MIANRLITGGYHQGRRRHPAQRGGPERWLLRSAHLRASYDILHSTIVGRSPNTLAGIAATEQGTVLASAVRVSGSEDGVRLTSSSVLRDSMVYGLAGDSSSHFDAVTADGYRGWRIIHNTILNRHDLVGAVWVGDSRYGPSAGLLSGNYIAGGGYSIYSGTGAAPGSAWSATVSRPGSGRGPATGASSTTGERHTTPGRATSGRTARTAVAPFFRERLWVSRPDRTDRDARGLVAVQANRRAASRRRARASVTPRTST